MRFCQAVAGLGFKVTLHQSSILQGCTLSGLCATHNKHGLMNNAIHLRSFLYYVFSFPLGSLFAVSISFTCDETLMSGGGDCSTKVLGGLHLWYYHLFPLWWKKCREQEKLFILLQCVKSNQHSNVTTRRLEHHNSTSYCCTLYVHCMLWCMDDDNHCGR